MLKKIRKYLKRKKRPHPNVERRRSPRISAKDVFFVEYKRGRDVVYEYASGRDISVHGVRFATNGKVKKGACIEVRIIFPSKFGVADKLELKAKVVRIYRPKHVKRDRVGCEFIHESNESRDLLKKFSD